MLSFWVYTEAARIKITILKNFYRKVQLTPTFFFLCKKQDKKQFHVLNKKLNKSCVIASLIDVSLLCFASERSRNDCLFIKDKDVGIFL